MSEVKVNLGERSYVIRIGSGILSELAKWCVGGQTGGGRGDIEPDSRSSLLRHRA